MTKRNALTFGALGLVVLAVPQSASAGLLDTLQTTVQATTAPWVGKSLDVADGTFGLFFGVYVVWAICSSALKSWSGEQDIGSALQPWGNAIMMMIVPYAVLHVFARGILPDLVGNAMKLGGLITGDAVLQSPDTVAMLGFNQADALVQSTATPLQHDMAGINVFGLAAGLDHTMGALVTSFFMFCFASVAGIFLIIAFCIAAAELLSALIIAYIAIAVGACSLGFLGASGTAFVARSYMQQIWATVIRLVVITAWITLVADIVAAWKIAAAVADLHTFLFTGFEMVGGSIFIAYMTIRLSMIASHVAGGSGGAAGADLVAMAQNNAASTARAIRTVAMRR
jgi:hypothetical protein